MPLAPDVSIVFDLNGERKTLSYHKLPFSAWSALKAHLGFTPASLLDAVSNYDLEAFGAIIWLERKQHDRMCEWPTVRDELEKAEVAFELVDLQYDGASHRLREDDADPTPATANPPAAHLFDSV